MAKQDLIKARKQFVGQKRKAARSNENVAAAKMALGQPSKKGPSDAALRKKFFIKTRTEELKAAGKKVDRKKLAARYESGKVKREGFYAGGAKEKAKRIEAAKPKPKVAPKKYGSARAFETATSKSGSSAPAAKNNKGYSEAAYMALGQPAGKKSTTTTSTTKKSTTKKSTTTKKPTTSKSSGSARSFEK